MVIKADPVQAPTGRKCPVELIWNLFENCGAKIKLLSYTMLGKGEKKKVLTQSEVSQRIILGSSEQTMKIVSRKKNEMVLQSL